MKAKKQLKQLTEIYFSSPYGLHTRLINMGYPSDFNMDAIPQAKSKPEPSLNERQDFMTQKIQQGNLSRCQSAMQDEFLEGMLSVLAKQEQEKRKMKGRIDELELLSANLSSKLKKEKCKSHKLEKLCKEMAREILKIEKFLLLQSCFLGISDKKAKFDELPYDWKAYYKLNQHKATPAVACLPDCGGRN